MPLSHEVLVGVYAQTPGLTSDKIKATLEFAWEHLRQQDDHKVIFAYDEAQNLTDHAGRDQFPLSVLLDVFQSIQKKGIPFMLVLAGLPTLFPKLVDARTYAERMFRVVTLTKLSADESREAIIRPIEVAECPVNLTPDSVEVIIHESAGYPYFIQFICREVYDVFIRQHADEEFTISELTEMTKALLPKGFSPSNANQMLASLAERGMIYKNRFGKYSFAVPLLGRFILRTYKLPDPPQSPNLVP